jgi:hypothetical protein
MRRHSYQLPPSPVKAIIGPDLTPATPRAVLDQSLKLREYFMRMIDKTDTTKYHGAESSTVVYLNEALDSSEELMADAIDMMLKDLKRFYRHQIFGENVNGQWVIVDDGEPYVPSELRPIFWFFSEPQTNTKKLKSSARSLRSRRGSSGSNSGSGSGSSSSNSRCLVM